MSFGILGWLIGGDAAERMSHLSDDELIAAALDSLPIELSHGKQLLKEGVVKRWIKAVSSLPGGNNAPPLHVRHCPEPTEHPQLFFVGDYLFDSTLNGVLDSAEYVAGWITGNLLQPTSRKSEHASETKSLSSLSELRVNKGSFACQPVI